MSRKRLSAAIHLYALSNDCKDRLREHVWKSSIIEKYGHVQSEIGLQDIQDLALSDTSLLTLPMEYRDILQAFSEAYHLPERQAEEKHEMRARARELQFQTGVKSTTIAEATGIALPNVVSYLKNGAVEKVTLKGARDILTFLEKTAR